MEAKGSATESYADDVASAALEDAEYYAVVADAVILDWAEDYTDAST